MSTTLISITVTDAMKKFIEEESRARNYSLASEYLCELIRKDQIAKAEAKLKELLLDGLNSGPAVIVDENFFAEIKAKLRRAKDADLPTPKELIG